MRMANDKSEGELCEVAVSEVEPSSVNLTLTLTLTLPLTCARSTSLKSNPLL